MSADEAPSAQVAYLVVAHYQPRHVARLIRTTNHPGAVFFVHVDAKAPVDEFASLAPPGAEVIFIDKRVEVTWGDVTLTHALLNLMRAATATNRPFRYFLSLSGSDYPIKPAAVIHARLAEATQEFMRIDRQPSFEPDAPYPALAGLADGKFYADLVPWHGSVHWALTTPCVRFILDFADANPGFLALCRDVFCPEEIFFHSIVKQSPFASAISQDYSTTKAPDFLHHGIHFIDWQGLRPRQLRLNLDMRDFGILTMSPALFARKFDEQASADLLAMLDRYVHGALL